MTFRGRIWIFGDHVDTDAIIPACHLHSSDPAELARHCMEGLDSDFADGVRPGDMIVAGENFGCGSSREHAPLAIQAAGVGCVVAESFARIFYRNAFNTGLPVIGCAGVLSFAASTRVKQEWIVDIEAGRIRNLSLGTEIDFEPFPPFMAGLLHAGGLTAYTRARIAAGSLPMQKGCR